jgi:glyoxylase-like metal-dependent hydrolase (beta-lactamase superfamily II)
VLTHAHVDHVGFAERVRTTHARVQVHRARRPGPGGTAAAVAAALAAR